MTARDQKTLMRETLEAMRDAFVADGDRIVLLTTFNFVPEFFEANVLPLLAGESAQELKNSPQVRYGLNDELKKLRCLVVCDRSTEPPAKGKLRYGLMTVGLPLGRFHPKLILMAGTIKATGQRGLMLAVGSSNLSLSGWGINREVIGATPVAAQHAAELLPLVQWLRGQADDQLRGLEGKEEGSTRAILHELSTWLADPERLQSVPPGAPTLHIAMPMLDRPRALAADLVGGRNWQRATVVSPYWGQVDTLTQLLGVQQCRFVPSLNAGRYLYPLASLANEGQWQRSFARFDDDRYTHAKVLMLEDSAGRAVLCVGSANFTGAALGRPQPGQFANVEAMLRYELAAVPASLRTLRTLDESVLKEKDAADADEQAPPLPPFAVSVYYDWQRRAFGGHLTVTQGARIAGLVLHLAGMEVALADAGHALDLSQPYKCRQPVRSFRVNWDGADGARATFHGLVIQVNALDDELLYQPPPRLDDVLEFLRGLNPAHPGGDPRTHAGRGDSGGDGDEDEREANFDYFALFQGTWKLREYYDSVPAATRRLIAFDDASRFSVSTLYRAIALQPDQTSEERIARYIQLSEVRELMDSLQVQGIVPGAGAGAGVAEIGREIDDLATTLAGLLGASPTFRGMFGDVPAPAQVAAFMAWFRTELKEKGTRHGG